MPTQKEIARAVLDRHGKLFSRELGVDVSRGTPAALFRTFVFALLASTRISHRTAMKAAKALVDHGWTTARKMAGSTWRQRTAALNRAGYARYDESTSRMLGDTCALLIEKYGGDLRRLREEAERDSGKERQLLKACKGIGEVGVDIFAREAQAAWDEWRPFADKVAIKAARRLKLGTDAKALAKLVPAKDYPRLIAGLVRVQLENDYDGVREAAQRPRKR